MEREGRNEVILKIPHTLMVRCVCVCEVSQEKVTQRTIAYGCVCFSHDH